jgi:hypothetical protein
MPSPCLSLAGHDNYVNYPLAGKLCMVRVDKRKKLLQSLDHCFVLLEISALPARLMTGKTFKVVTAAHSISSNSPSGPQGPAAFELIQLPFVYGQDPVAAVFWPGLCPLQGSLRLKTSSSMEKSIGTSCF